MVNRVIFFVFTVSTYLTRGAKKRLDSSLSIVVFISIFICLLIGNVKCSANSF